MIGLPSGEKTLTYFLVNNNVQFASQMVLIPTSVLVKEGIMYPVVENYYSNCGIVSVAVSDNLYNFLFDVPTLIFEALLLGVPCGDDGAMYR